MSRRVLIRAALFLLFSFLVLFAMAVQNMNKARKYEQIINDAYGYAFAELVADVSKLDYALWKSRYATTGPLLTSLCTEVYSESSASMAALSRLPVSELNLENTAKFISRTGDYAFSLSKKLARGESISEEERKALLRMSESASDINRMLHGILEKIATNSIDIADVKLNGYTAFDGENEDILKLEREFSEYPVLIYDGPFSDHIGKKEADFTKNMPEISEDEGRERVAEVFMCDEETLSFDGMRSEGENEIYSFHRDFEGYSVYADVTKRGGKILRIISSREAQAAQYTEKEAIDKAKDFLNTHGFENMKETYHMRYGSALTINFAAYENNTVMYPDLIKVTVALDDMSIINLDASGYIMNHHTREIADISEGEKHAEKLISEDLKVLAYSMAVIPTDSEGEVLAHEFKCENADGMHCIVYINAKSYDEEKILILLEDENGTLVI